MSRFSIKFVLGTYINKDLTKNIYLRVIINRQKKDFYSGLQIKPECFNELEQLIVIPREKKLTSELNMILTQIKGKANDVFVHFSLLKADLDIDIFTSHFSGPDKRISFSDFYEKSIEFEKKIQEPATWGQYFQTLDWMKKFKPSWSFADLSVENIKLFDAFMQKNGLKINTRWKHHKNIKKFMLIAKTQMPSIQNPYTSFKPKKADSTRMPLTKPELLRLIDLYYKKDLPSILKDGLGRFIFSCICGGMRFSDVNNFAKMILSENDITFMPIKTKRFEKIVQVPIPDFARDFLNHAKHYLIIPKHNSVINKALKQISYIADLEKPLTFHISRYTFACLYLDATKDQMSLMDIMGISKFDTIRTYVKIYEDSKRGGMKKFSNLFESDIQQMLS